MKKFLLLFALAVVAMPCGAHCPCPSNEIWYTNGSTTEPTKPRDIFDVNIISNTYYAENECWVIKFDGEVTTIGLEAFGGCSNLTSVTIPDSVITIWATAFGGCSSLREFNGKYASEDGRCLIVDDTLNSFAPAGLTEYTIPDSVTTIGNYAFYSCSSLTSVTIPDSVTIIGVYAFAGCSSLREFNGKYASDNGRCLIIDGTLNSFAPAGLSEYTIPDSVTTIGYGAFAYCSSLTSVTIPDSVTTIGKSAFYGCSSLISVTIPDSVTAIGIYTFYNCSSLTSVYCKAITPPTGGWRMFGDNASGRKIYVPMESVEAYKSASYWSNYSYYIEGYNF